MSRIARLPAPTRRDLLLAAVGAAVAACGPFGRGCRDPLGGLPDAPLDAFTALGAAYLAIRPGLSEDTVLDALDGRVGPLGADPPALRARIASAIEADFANGATVTLGGWIVAETTARLGALVALSRRDGS